MGEKKVILFLLIGFLMTTEVYSFIMSDQAVDVKKNGIEISQGNLTIELYRSSIGGTPFFNTTFTNKIINGSWSVYFNITNLVDGETVYKAYKINGINISFINMSGSPIQRLPMSISFGENTTKYLINVTNKILFGNYFIDSNGDAELDDVTANNFYGNLDWSYIDNEPNLAYNNSNQYINNTLFFYSLFTNSFDQSIFYDWVNDWFELSADLKVLGNIIFTGGTFQTNNLYVENYTLINGTLNVTNNITSDRIYSDLYGNWNGSIILENEIDTKLNITDQRYNDTNKINNILFSSGVITQPTITYNPNISVTLGKINVSLYNNTNNLYTPKKYSVNSKIFNLTDNQTNYIYVDYNNGNPEYRISLNVELINLSNTIPVFTIVRTGTVYHSLDWDKLGLGLSDKILNRLVKTNRFARESGLTLSYYGNLYLNVSSGIAWYGATRKNIQGVSSPTDKIITVYHSGSNWLTNFTTTQLNNNWYDDGTNRVALTANRYAINWIYRGIEDQKHVYILYGAGDYTLAQAQSATVPTPPTIISSHALLIGKIIIQKGSTTPHSIQTTFDTLSSQGVSEHSDLTGLDGDDHQQYILVDGTRSLTGNWVNTYNITANTFKGKWNGSTEYTKTTELESKYYNTTETDTLLDENYLFIINNYYNTSKSNLTYIQNSTSTTSNYIPKWTSNMKLGNSAILDNGTQIKISENLNLTSSTSCIYLGASKLCSNSTAMTIYG